MQQRVGNRVWAKHPVPAQSDENGAGPSGNNGIRARIEAAHAEFDPKQSTSRASYDADIWKFQTGIDGMFTETASGKFIGGVYVQYGTVSSSVSSPFGNGSIRSSGYGAGATLTWYGESDFYIDGVAQINWFDSDLNSATLGRQLVDGNRAVGYSLSVETGQKIEIGEGWSLTPQAQLAYSAIRFDDFKDAFDTSVSPENDHDLTGRLGLAINRCRMARRSRTTGGHAHLRYRKPLLRICGSVQGGCFECALCERQRAPAWWYRSGWNL